MKIAIKGKGSMVKAQWYIVVLVVTLFIAIIDLGSYSPDLAPFYTTLFIGVWVLFLIYFVARVMYLHEFNAPHNIAGFVFELPVIGIIYCLFSHFASILSENLLYSPDIYFSWWDLIFGVGFLMYGCVALWRCFAVYDFIYVGRAAVKSRSFGLFTCGFLIALEFAYAIILFTVVIVPHPNQVYIDVPALLFGIYLTIVVIRHGIFGRRGMRPIRVTTERPAVIDAQPVIATSRRTPARKPQPKPKPRARTQAKARAMAKPKSSPKPAARPKPRAQVKPRSQPKQAVKMRPVRATTAKPRPAAKPSLSAQRSKVNTAKFEALRPKAGVLSREDFKCIFCFQEPSLPADAARSFVICPNCRHPAHFEEFDDWRANSSLCSRCNASLPADFLRHPQIIPGKTYIEVIKYFVEKAKNRQ